MLKGLWSRAFSPSWRILTVGVVLLVVHSLWGYIEARRLEKAAQGVEMKAIPGRRHPRENRLDDAARFYEASWVLVPNVELRPAVPEDQPPGARELEWLAMLEPSLEMLDRGAELSACRFLWQDDLPSNRSLRDVSRAASLRTRDRLRAGDIKGALASTMSSFRHLRVFTAEAPLFGHIMRGGLLEVALGDVQRILESAPPGPARTQLQPAVDAQILANEIEDALTAERAWMLRFLSRSLNDGWGFRHADNWIVRPAVRHFAVSALEHMSDAIQASRGPWPERIQRLVDMEEPAGPAAQAVPSVKRVARNLARTAALTHAMSACLLIEQHRNVHGALPEAVPPSAPTDPFNGQPLKYRREVTGYAVYSVGEDGTDGGGSLDRVQGSDYGYRIRTLPPVPPR